MGLAREKEKRYTYKDYLTWPEAERWELIDGAAYDMSPAPKVKHQRIVSRFDCEFTIKNKECDNFIALTDVVLDDYNIVQPDVFIEMGAGEHWMPPKEAAVLRNWTERRCAGFIIP